MAKCGLNDITGAAVNAGLRIHSALGSGMLEAIYEAVLARDLVRKGYKVERQKLLSFTFEGMCFRNMLKLDLLIEDAVVIEVKSVATINSAHEKQLLTYLKLLHLPLGLILNFGAPMMKDGIRRIING